MEDPFVVQYHALARGQCEPVLQLRPVKQSGEGPERLVVLGHFVERQVEGRRRPVVVAHSLDGAMRGSAISHLDQRPPVAQVEPVTRPSERNAARRKQTERRQVLVSQCLGGSKAVH